MLRLALAFLIIALIAGALNMGFVAGIAWDGARILFFIFLVLAVLAFLAGSFRRTPV
jgi:uncharacterized membrane protein YtjA (UPF0391 family)